MVGIRATTGFWIKALLIGGGLLALALLAQTILNYRYVSSALVRQEARRIAAERVRDVERNARIARSPDAVWFNGILEDLRQEASDQLAWIALVQSDGALLAGSELTEAMLAQQERTRFAADRGELIERESADGREILIGFFPCRCGFTRRDASPTSQSGRTFLEVAIYRDSLSAPFARLRRNAAISASAALVLLLSVSLIAIRFDPYVRGKQLEVEIDIARKVQGDLLPRPDVLPKDLDVAAECIPASKVGGDFYDVVVLPGGRIAFMLGDVSGHGVSAALLMGLIHGAMSSPPWGADDTDPAVRAAQLNELLLTKTSGERYASLFWAVFESATGVLQYVNAGHLPPLLLRRGPDQSVEVRRLSEGGPVLGLLAAPTHHVATVQARAGDLVVLFSDGIIEATNQRNDQFGEDRLIEIVRARADNRSRVICDAIVAAASAFSGDPPLDDRTVLVVRL